MSENGQLRNHAFPRIAPAPTDERSDIGFEAQLPVGRHKATIRIEGGCLKIVIKPDDEAEERANDRAG